MAKAPKTVASDDTQSFKAIFNVAASGGSAAPGESIDLTRDEFDLLKHLGAIEGEWAEAAPAPQA